MVEYIERRIAVDLIADTMARGFVEDRFIMPQELQDLQDELETLSASDVAPVAHGRWEKSSKYAGFLCCSSCCDSYVLPEWVNNYKWKFCPSCGAKMDLNDGKA